MIVRVKILDFDLPCRQIRATVDAYGQTITLNLGVPDGQPVSLAYLEQRARDAAWSMKGIDDRARAKGPAPTERKTRRA